MISKVDVADGEACCIGEGGGARGGEEEVKEKEMESKSVGTFQDGDNEDMDEAEEQWELKHVYTASQIKKCNALVCSE